MPSDAWGASDFQLCRHDAVRRKALTYSWLALLLTLAVGLTCLSQLRHR